MIMRAIKFRGKTTNCINNGWIYGDLINYRDDDKRIMEQNYGAWDVLETAFEVDESTIGQFAGVQDRTNTDVYEGDIIKLNGQKYVIKYFDEYALFGFSRPNDLDNPKPVGSRGSSTAYKPYVLSHFYQRRIEVVGNIHDNHDID